MKRLTKILTSIFLLVEIINGQCLGDLNMDYRIDEYDLNIFSNHLLFDNDTLLTNADFDYNNSAEETLNCDYKGDDIQIGFNSRFLIEMINNLDQEEIKLFMSLPNRAGIIKPSKEDLKSEEITMLVMPVMLNE